MPAARRAPSVPWDRAEPAPLVLITGPEELLAERAVQRLVALGREQRPDLEVAEVDAAAYQPGQLRVLTSPSLFADERLVVVEELQAGPDELFADLLEYVAQPAPGIWLVLRHGGGVRGKKVLDAVRAGGAVVVTCDEVRRDAEKSDFVAAEFGRLGRRAQPAAIRALVEAVGADLRELAAACQQLVADTAGEITAEVVRRYHGGRVEATGFRVADAAVAGNAGEAVALLRHAMATGTDPVPIVAALAAKLRTMAKVGAARGRGLDPVKDLGLAQWQVDRARRELAHWNPDALAGAICVVAEADAEVKGGGRDAEYAVERAVLWIAGAAG
jgi:DNA polymerase III subunit delta